MAANNKKPKPSVLRIIAGDWRGKRIEFQQNSAELRPTGDRIRETLFNWLSTRIVGADCLDMYAGSGVLGFEALSRGASRLTFFEQNRDTARQLKHNLRKLETDLGRVRQGDALRLLNAEHGQWDVVFLDPPFTGTDYGNLCTLLEQSGRLASDALIYLEMPGKSDWPVLPANWQMIREKTAGQVRYALIARQP